MKVRFLHITIIILLAALFVSCGSSEAIGMIDQLRADQDQKIAALSTQISADEEKIASIRSEINTLKKQVSALETTLSGLQKEFEFTYNTINEFVSYAGYESSDDFLSLGRDIVGVNQKIDDFNARIAALQDLMKQFIDQ